MYNDIWIIGGQTIYEQYINKPYIDRICLTEIEDNHEGDTFFPEMPEHFLKTIHGESKIYKRNAVSFGNYNINTYSNCGQRGNHMS